MSMWFEMYPGTEEPADTEGYYNEALPPTMAEGLRQRGLLGVGDYLVEGPPNAMPEQEITE